jgi:hypothetical protein
MGQKKAREIAGFFLRSLEARDQLRSLLWLAVHGLTRAAFNRTSQS